MLKDPLQATPVGQQNQLEHYSDHFLQKVYPGVRPFVL